MGEGWGPLWEKPGEEKKSGEKIPFFSKRSGWVVSGSIILSREKSTRSLIWSYSTYGYTRIKKYIFIVNCPLHPTCFSVVQKGRFPRTNGQLSILDLCNITWLEVTHMDFIALKLLFGVQIALQDWSMGEKKYKLVKSSLEELEIEITCVTLYKYF